MENPERSAPASQLLPSKLNTPKEKPSFAEQAKRKSPGWLAELIHFVAHNKKWWLVPVLVVLLLVGALVMLGGSGVAPFIYAPF